MVGGYTEDLTEPSSSMHRNGYLFVYIYSSIRGKEKLIPSCQTQYILICNSLIPRPEEEEKGFGFSLLSMCLIAVEFHGDRIILTYYCTLVMLKLILRITLSRFTSSIQCVKKLPRLHSSIQSYKMESASSCEVS